MESAHDTTLAGLSVWVTRPSAQATGLCQRLSACSAQVIAFPLLRVAGLHAVAPSPLMTYRAVIFISANAVHYGLPHLLAEGEAWPQAVHCIAVGRATAALLTERGINVQRPSSVFSSEGVLALPVLQAIAGQPILLVQGQGGRKRLADTLIERGANVARLVCYQRMPVEESAATWAQHCPVEAIGAIVITSGMSLTALCERIKGPQQVLWQQRLLVVISDRLARLASEQGFYNVVVADEASDDAIVAVLQRWRRQPIGCGDEVKCER